ncbi:MAG: bifunctional adenosylcobinamide kinase/adenosylcobinamide-phosphate guanylyltransferase [Spirochaetaceae bacterium]|jgi:adenosyl cobinamide kinase/adenosyl cobinamide phosphate guanylyltransferase|nr:bifunctional adenosylcobinamide kinase/adenosylcobinamide-phosphate guanylyltransferase [Spirochaetaceae bacterium]
MKAMIMLITGGVKAGKSRRALAVALERWPGAIAFVATAEALDGEMESRIRRHQEERAALGGSGRFTTIEEPLELDKALVQAGGFAVVDCLPMWVNNRMYYKREQDFLPILERAVKAMGNCIVVSNETGLGNIPFDEDVRRYNTLLAHANRIIAAAADSVECMIAGIPLKVK